jgi:ketosteroid isomerase-like protein
MKRLFPLCLFAFAFVACNEKASDTTIAADSTEKKESVDYKAVINETNKQFTSAALKGDSAAFVSLYHPDAQIFPPNGEMVIPRQMGSMMAGFQKMGVTSFDLQTKEIFEGDDDVVTEVGTYTMSDGKKFNDKGKYIVVWKKDGDKWKLYRDIWNSDNPPPPPAPGEKKK